MKAIDLVVRCMAWPEDGVSVATCMDYTLAAQGDSLEEARSKLHAQIRSYVVEVLTIDEAHADELLMRHAPMKDRLRFGFWRLVNERPHLRRTAGKLVRTLKVALKNRCSYFEPLPMQPA